MEKSAESLYKEVEALFQQAQAKHAEYIEQAQKEGILPKFNVTYLNHEGNTEKPIQFVRCKDIGSCPSKRPDLIYRKVKKNGELGAKSCEMYSWNYQIILKNSKS